MNKKLLFAAMSLVAFTACTDTDFESQKVAEETSNVQFEVINANDAFTRASMGGTDNNTISWSAKDGDLFTLYFGASSTPYTKGYDNATYTAKAEEGKPASLTTPTMIKAGEAIMVWPVDTTFRIKTGDALTIKIPVEQVNTADEIPYVSDRITIGAYEKYNEDAEKGKVTAWNTAGKDRKYPVYMRPMASQLNLKADYDGTDATLKELEKGEDGITPIKVTSIDLLTNESGSTLFTKVIPVKFDETANAAWATVEKNAFSAQTQFDVTNIVPGIGDNEGQTAKLTAKDKCLLPNNVGAKILILPQKNITETGAKVDGTDDAGVADAAVVVNTIYGKVVVAKPSVSGSKYTTGQWENAWYRYIKTTSKKDYETLNTGESITGTDGNPRYKATSSIAHGMMQTINAFSSYKAPAELPVEGEDMGTAINRYVKVLLTHLDMSDLHVKDDKQLRDVARVWKQMGLDPVTVYLDGGQADATKGTTNFAISQKTIKVINEVNKSSLDFQVKPCNEKGEECTHIVITGSSDIQAIQDIAFITYNDVDESGDFNKGDIQAKVVLADEGTAKPWKWNKIVKVAADGVERIINKGTMENAATATLQTAEYNGTQNNVLLQNDGTWDIKNSGTILNVQFDVTNNGKVNIDKNAQYRQDGRKDGVNTLTTFTNQATNVPKRFGGNDAEIGLVNNSGVFATVALGQIINYGLIEHIEDDAKTYITKNQTTSVSFSNAFSDTNKRGRINLRFSNKNEDNISVSAAASEGFISVTVTADDLKKAGITSDVLDASIVGDRVNYIIINSGIKTISKVSPQVQYLEIDDADDKEIAWNVTDATEYVGLMVLSDVNVKLNTTINVTRATYLGADMYVGGTFTTAAWKGYYGDTDAYVASQYITY